MFVSRMAGLAAGMALIVLPKPGFSQTATANFNVQITITAECRIVSASDLNFGSNGVLAANVDATSTIAVQCTNNTPYTLALGPGNGAGATVASRKMTSGGATINYSLYTTAARTSVWGNTTGTDTQAGTGNGASQSFTVYGRVPAQTTPAPGTYNDVVAVTISY